MIPAAQRNGLRCNAAMAASSGIARHPSAAQSKPPLTLTGNAEQSRHYVGGSSINPALRLT
jgi:hypothetical protein